MPLYDFECPQGHADYEVRCSIAAKDAVPHPCPECGAGGHVVILTAPAMPTTIVLDYPGSKKHKAGYAHTHADRPGTKIQVGAGGKTSYVERPTAKKGEVVPLWRNPIG